MAYSTLILEAVVAVITFLLLRSKIRQRSRLPLPPGPKGYPLISNLFDIPREYENITFADWYKKYGDVVHAKAFGQSFIVLNTWEAVLELLEKRSDNYSDRPCGTMLNKLMKCDWMFSFMNNGAGLKARRKVFLTSFRPQAVKTFAHIQEQKTHTFLLRLLKGTDNDLQNAVHFYTSSIILGIIYGYHIKDENDEIDVLCRSAVTTLVRTMNQIFVVDLIPILRHVPSWFPGAKFKRDAEEWKREMVEMREKPFEYTQGATTPEQCMVSQHLSRIDGLPTEMLEEEMQVLKDAAGLGYIAGMDTTKASIRAFCLAMILYPDIQKRAQAEIDRILGEPGTRMPTFEDKEKLPYIQALLSEVSRWHPVAPIGIPHRSVNDDVYNGYFIPAGSIVFGNTHAILHDPIEYPDPQTLNPDRFIPQNGRKLPMDPSQAAFGYGRRVCPGQYLVIETMWIASTSLLAAFNILPALDKDGKTPIMPTTEYLPGSVAAPKDFPCRFVPRSEKVVQLLSNLE